MISYHRHLGARASPILGPREEKAYKRSGKPTQYCILFPHRRDPPAPSAGSDSLQSPCSGKKGERGRHSLKGKGNCQSSVSGSGGRHGSTIRTTATAGGASRTSGAHAASPGQHRETPNSTHQQRTQGVHELQVMSEAQGTFVRVPCFMETVPILLVFGVSLTS